MNTVILVHGYTFAPRRMRFMAGYLRRRGWNVLTPELRPSDGSVPLEAMAAMLAEYIRSNTEATARLDLIGFSMGGLVCRYYIQSLDGAARTDRFISISTPHHGTHIARLFRGDGMAHMRPGSAFLETLNRDTTALENVACSVFYTPFDFIILPARSSILPFALVRKFYIPAHPLMIYHPAVFQTLAQVLSAPGAQGGPAGGSA